ncbi:MAG: hypothetical protein EOO43_22820 [Flavobacterium sp.]|nr:MAG: hypothetical protein EOO43_22820 [Flavobacterium sp.]
MANHKRLHALHNKTVCKLLNEAGGGEMNDWVVTTAFYSALHFVHGEIFPLPGKRRVFTDFESYYNSEHPEQSPSKHTVTNELVADHLPKLSGKYKWLFKECHNARYRNYTVNPLVAATALKYLEEIEESTAD